MTIAGYKEYGKAELSLKLQKVDSSNAIFQVRLPRPGKVFLSVGGSGFPSNTK